MTDKQIKELIHSEWKAIEQSQKRCDDRIKRHKKRISEFQKNCPHNKTTYHPDPSGNNDSFIDCDICGKEL